MPSEDHAPGAYDMGTAAFGLNRVNFQYRRNRSIHEHQEVRPLEQAQSLVSSGSRDNAGNTRDVLEAPVAIISENDPAQDDYSGIEDGNDRDNDSDDGNSDNDKTFVAPSWCPCATRIKTRRTFHVFLSVLLMGMLAVVGGITTGVVLFTATSNDTDNDPTDESLCSIDHKVVLDQCNSGVGITLLVPDCARDLYTLFTEVAGNENSTSNTTTFQQCSISNLALLWLAVAATNDPSFMEKEQNESTTYSSLVSLFFATNGPAWHRNTGWLEDTDYCDWYGIKCGDGSNTVVSITLPKNNLDGYLATELGRLSSLGKSMDGVRSAFGRSCCVVEWID